jgi:hypothetical protein
LTRIVGGSVDLGHSEWISGRVTYLLCESVRVQAIFGLPGPQGQVFQLGNSTGLPPPRVGARLSSACFQGLAPPAFGNSADQ